MRLAKFLAHGGVASRRGAEEIVAAGRVSVDGEVVTDPARDVDDTYDVRVDGRPIRGAEPHVVYALNKPAGVVSTARDTHGRTTVTELVRSSRRLYPVGRLDAETTGLILLTNDGELANRLTHPRYGVRKTYVAKLSNPPIREPDLRRLREGVTLDDGKTAPAGVRRLSFDSIELVLREGRKRQVRRMCEAVGHPVTDLRRVRIGPLALGSLAEGEVRRLTPTEVERLRSAASAPAPPRNAR